MRMILCLVVIGILSGCCDMQPIPTYTVVWSNYVPENNNQVQFNRDYYECKMMVENLIATQYRDPVGSNLVMNLTGDAKIEECIRARGWYTNYSY